MKAIFPLTLFCAAGLVHSLAVCASYKACPPPRVSSNDSCEVVPPERKHKQSGHASSVSHAHALQTFAAARHKYLSPHKGV